MEEDKKETVVEVTEEEETFGDKACILLVPLRVFLRMKNPMR